MRFHYVPKQDYHSNFFLKICLQIFDLNPLLLHSITIADSHRAILFRLKIISHAERRTNLILTAIAFADIAAVVKLAVVIFAQFCIDLLSTLISVF